MHLVCGSGLIGAGRYFRRSSTKSTQRSGAKGRHAFTIRS
jgi:hypothetical protein